MKNSPCLLLLVALSCTKQDLKSNCKSLKEGIINDDVNKVNSSISKFVDELANKTHTSDNLTLLAQKISAGCSVKVEVLCYGCIYTFPAISEITVSFSTAGTTITKVIDISENSSKEMKFTNMHN